MIYWVFEIWESIQRNQVRTVLSSIGVFWGIFVLIVLLGLSEGLIGGIRDQIRHFSRKVVWILNSSPQTDTGHRHPLVNPSNLGTIKNLLASHWAYALESEQLTLEVRFNEMVETALVKGVEGHYFDMMALQLNQGRILNVRDNQEKRKVAVIGERVRNSLFGSESAVGKSVQLGNSSYLIIGQLADHSIAEQYERNTILAPLRTFRNHVGHHVGVARLGVAIPEAEDLAHQEHILKQKIGRLAKLDRGQWKNIQSYNTQEIAEQFQTLFRLLKGFIWIVGLSLILVSFFGVCNLAWYSVSQRQNEIAIRKSLGASPISIALLIVGETLTLFVMSGGLAIALAQSTLIVLSATLLYLLGEQYNAYVEFGINWNTLTGCIALLLLGGVLAGVLPAARAANMFPGQVFQ